ncbi:MAG: hypothetical protein KGL40_02445 [Rhodocyclaceae bacterium]|nr:hypothetical protein [Rhodocyclaceae bacterium]
MKGFKTLIFLSALTSVLVGCATPATYQAMTVQPGPQTAAPNPKLKGQVEVAAITGGKETNPLWTSQVDNENFKKALVDTLAIAGYQPATDQKGKYRLSAELKELDQPVFGLTLDVKSSIVYTLEAADGSSDKRTIPVNATGTATVSDAFVAIERLRIANERSILENLKSLLQQLQAF